jgi:hypothetical protein
VLIDAIARTQTEEKTQLETAHDKSSVEHLIIDGYGSKSTNSDLAGFYFLLYIRRQRAGLYRRRTNVNDVFDNNKKIVSYQ